MSRDRSTWRDHALSLGVNPDEPDDARYWGAMDRAQAIIDSFKYHQPNPEQVGRISNVRTGAIAFARIILQNAKSSADQTAALRMVHEAMMTANKAIVNEAQ